MTAPTATPAPDGPRPEAAAEVTAAAATGAVPAATGTAADATGAVQAATGTAVTVTAVPAGAGPAGLIIRLPTDPEALRLLEAREEAVLGGEPACLLPRLCPRCGAPGETSVNRICTNCGAALTR